MILVWSCLKGKCHYDIIETMKMDETAQGECITCKKKEGLSDDSQEDQHLREM